MRIKEIINTFITDIDKRIGASRIIIVSGVALIILDSLQIDVPIVQTSRAIDTSFVVVAALIALYSYKFSVRSNLRGNLNELEPIRAGDYKLVPIISAVKWRPINPLNPTTTVQLLVYDVSGSSEQIVPSEDAFEMFGLNHSEIENYIEEYSQESDRIIDAEFNNSDKIKGGAYFSLYTTNPTEVRRAVQAVFIESSS